MFAFIADKRLATAETAEDVPGDPPQTKKRPLRPLAGQSSPFALQTINERNGSAHPGWRSLPFFENESVLVQEFMGFQRLAHQRHPVAETNGLLYLASYNPNAGFLPDACWLHVMLACVISNPISVSCWHDPL